MSRTLKNLGIKIPPEENTPLVRRLVEVIEKLVVEVDQPKGLPETPRRGPTPSPLKDPSAPPSQQQRKRKKRTRPKGHKRSKFQGMRIDETHVLQPSEVPEGRSAPGQERAYPQRRCHSRCAVSAAHRPRTY